MFRTGLRLNWREAFFAFKQFPTQQPKLELVLLGCLPICFYHPAARHFIGLVITPVSPGWAMLNIVAHR